MKNTRQIQIRALVNRLARLDSAQSWSGDLNPTQFAALNYLVQANKLSRSPSHVAHYLDTTRGTMSQTLKALERKGYVDERRSKVDKRSISFEVTDTGRRLVLGQNELDAAIVGLASDKAARLETILKELLRNLLALRNGRTFGLCHNCRHHTVRGAAPYCALLSMSLTAEEADQICHEHQEKVA